eukprot:4360868-Pyramimonas_sp.AAC.1
MQLILKLKVKSGLPNTPQSCAVKKAAKLGQRCCALAPDEGRGAVMASETAWHKLFLWVGSHGPVVIAAVTTVPSANVRPLVWAMVAMRACDCELRRALRPMPAAAWASTNATLWLIMSTSWVARLAAAGAVIRAGEWHDVAL